MVPSKPKGAPELPEWAEGLRLSVKSKRVLARILSDKSGDVGKEIEHLLQLGDQLDVFLEEVRVIVEEGDHMLTDLAAFARQNKASAKDLDAVMGAITSDTSDELRGYVSPIEKLRRIADRIRARKEGGVARGDALRIQTAADDAADVLMESSCDDRGSAVYAMIEKHYERVKKDWSPLTEDNLRPFLRDFINRAFRSVRARRTRGGPNRVRKEIRDPKKRPEIKAEVSRMCKLIVLRDYSLRKVVTFTPTMLAALLRTVPSAEDMEAIFVDYRNLRKLPQHSRIMAWVGHTKKSFYFGAGTEEEREAEIDPDIRQRCTGITPTNVVRVEYITDQDLFDLRSALHPRDVVEAKIAPPHVLAGKTIRLRSTIKNEFEVIDIEGENIPSPHELERELNTQPLNFLQAEFTVQWAKDSENQDPQN